MILHIDMDAFYASIEERERPELAGKPVIVGGTPEGRGVVAAANYAARTFGVHSAMPAVRAKRLCPHAVFLPSRMSFYAQVSNQIRAIFECYTPLVEPLSLDEAFLDVTGSHALYGSSIEIGRQIKREIRSQLQLVASVGVAPNKFLAKIASDLEKPDGFVVVDPNRVEAFLDPLPVGRLWGVGRVTGEALKHRGIRVIGDLRRMPENLLKEQFGDHGQHLGRLAHGIDERRVVPDRQAKSISHETTFARDIDDEEVLQAWVVELAEYVACRLRRQNLYGRTVHLKVRFSNFRTITRAQKLANPSNVTQDIYQAAANMLSLALPSRHLAVRLVGVGVSGLNDPPPRQRLLFDEKKHMTQQRIDSTSDQIRDRFGHSSLTRASIIQHEAKHTPRPRKGDR